ncbi:hypothetical protein [Frankia sp. Cj3]|uniref:hypothetical protein n=1 Tax=Frankia sp. Cj3 TaxID=2880976 RepID=UPI001EF5811C|nr:hypothetical protein [Frankia sp. Cj3]
MPLLVRVCVPSACTMAGDPVHADGAAGVTVLLVADAADRPTALRALTVNETPTPLVSPVMVPGDAVTTAVCPVDAVIR